MTLQLDVAAVAHCHCCGRPALQWADIKQARTKPRASVGGFMGPDGACLHGSLILLIAACFPPATDSVSEQMRSSRYGVRAWGEQVWRACVGEHAVDDSSRYGVRVWVSTQWTTAAGMACVCG